LAPSAGAVAWPSGDAARFLLSSVEGGSVPTTRNGGSAKEDDALALGGLTGLNPTADRGGNPGIAADSGGNPGVAAAAALTAAAFISCCTAAWRRSLPNISLHLLSSASF